MPDYKKMYAIMFNAATDVLDILAAHINREYQDIAECRTILAGAQLKCEELYINAANAEAEQFPTE